MHFNIQLFPARSGDSFMLDYGDNDTNNYILVDGGTGGTKLDILEFILSLPPEKRKLELLVVTHIDRDHIEGVLKLLKSENLDFSVKEIWFNSWTHLVMACGLDSFGAKQGEYLSREIYRHKININESFSYKPIMISDEENIPFILLSGGLKITLLSPYLEHLKNLIPVWENEVRESGLEPGFGILTEEDEEPMDYEVFGQQKLPDVDVLSQMMTSEDDSEANGSSIAFIAEYNGKKMLLCADAHPGVILKSLNILQSGVCDFDLVKLSHHGSKHNISDKFLEKIKSTYYVVLSNGTNNHPDQQTIAKIIKSNFEFFSLVFNYRTPVNEVWDNSVLQNQYNYQSIYPLKNGNIVAICL